jgi:hypothetical protein
VGHEERTDVDGAERPAEVVERGKDLPVDRHQRRKVVVHEPEPSRRRVPGDDHHALARHARQLGQAARAIGPVVHGEDRERRAERRVAERQVGRGGPDDGGGAGTSLPQHRDRRLDGDDRAVDRLVRSAPGADVHHAGRRAQRLGGGGQPRVGSPVGVVATADRVVELPAHPMPFSRSRRRALPS